MTYFLSDFSPLVDSEIEVINNYTRYVDDKESELTIFLLKGDGNFIDVSYREEMLENIFDGDIIILSRTDTFDFVRFIKTWMNPDDHLLISESVFEYIKDKDFTSLPYTLLVDHNSERYSQYRSLNVSKFDYTAIEEKELTKKGMRLKTNRETLDIIADNALFFCKDIKDQMKNERYLHSVSVAKSAYDIAIGNGLKERECYLAGLLHDISKDMSEDVQRKIIAEHYPEYTDVPSFALHQFVGAYIAQEYFKASRYVTDMIMYHCTGKADMTSIQKCLYVADKREPTRRFKTGDDLKRAKEDLSKAFPLVLLHVKQYYKRKGIPFLETTLTRDMYSYYEGEIKDVKDQ